MAQPKKPTLSAQEERFVSAFIANGGNATMAARETGYAKTSAHVAGHRVKNRPHVAAAIEKRLKGIARKADVTKERVLQELAAIAYTNLGDLIRVNANGLPEINLADATMEQLAALSEVVTERTIVNDDGETVEKAKIKQHSKLGALSELSRIMGYHNNTVTIVDGREVDDIRAGRERVAAAARAKAGSQADD